MGISCTTLPGELQKKGRRYQAGLEKRKGASRPPYRLRGITSVETEAEAMGDEVRAAALAVKDSFSPGTTIDCHYCHCTLFPVKPRSKFQNTTGLPGLHISGTLLSMQDMKMLFSSRDRAQIEQVREKLLAAGVQCEVRDFPVDAETCGTSTYPELWVRADPDYHTASILYASPVRVLRQQGEGRDTVRERFTHSSCR
jgi:hypothetical protein